MSKDESNHNNPASTADLSDSEVTEAEEEAVIDEAEVGDDDVEHLDPESPEAKLAEAEAKVAEYLDGWQRSRAELENYRKRIAREKDGWRADILGEVLNKVLLAFDDFDLAMQNLPESLKSEDWVTGIQKVHKKFTQQLEMLEVSEIEAAGLEFDPNVHQAVMRAQSDTHEPGTVIEVLRKGYQVEGRIIRPALVKVAE